MTTTDILETIFVIKGASALQGALSDASALFSTVAETQGAAAGASAVFGAALTWLAENPLTLVVAGLGAMVVEINRGLEAFSKSEEAIGRIAIRLRDMGNSFPAEELVAFSTHLQELTGISHNVIERAGGLAASFGLTRQQIEQALPAVLDVATFNKIDPEQVLRKVFQAAGGRLQGLRTLGIDPKAIKGDVHDINNLLAQIGDGFRGTAEAFRNTLPGMEQALSTARQSFDEAVGRLFSPERLAWLKAWTFFLEGATRLLNAAADYWKIPTAADLGKGKPNELALKGDPEQTELMRQTASNTANLDPLVKEVLGGKGIVARRSFTLRDARMTFGV